MNDFIEIAPLPVLKETKKAVAVPVVDMIFSKSRVPPAFKENRHVKVFTLQGYSDREVVLIRKDDLSWLPKSQVKIDTLNNTVVAARPWVIIEKDLPIKYDILMSTTRDAVFELVKEGDLSYVYSNIFERIAEKLHLGRKGARYVARWLNWPEEDIVKEVINEVRK